MSNKLIFQQFKKEDEKIIKDWVKIDKLGMRFLSSYATDDFAHLIDFQKRYLWLVLEGAKLIGFFDFEIESEKKGYFVFYITENNRGKGLGYKLLEQALKLPEIKKVEVLEGGVEKENFFSIKTLEKAGFKFSSIDDGMSLYQLSNTTT